MYTTKTNFDYVKVCLCLVHLYILVMVFFSSLLSAKDRLTLTLSKSLYLLLQWWWSSFNLTFQSIYLSFYTQHRQTLTMSMSVYVLYICTYWWWSSFHLYYQQKTDWHWHCQSHSTFCYNGDGLLSTFLSFPSVTSPPLLVMVHSPLKRDGRRVLLQ